MGAKTLVVMHCKIQKLKDNKDNGIVNPQIYSIEAHIVWAYTKVQIIAWRVNLGIVLKMFILDQYIEWMGYF